MDTLAERVRDLTVVVPDTVWQETHDLASEVATLERRLELVRDLALTARDAVPIGKAPYWVGAILHAIGDVR